jgi:hypothetical protein
MLVAFGPGARWSPLTALAQALVDAVDQSVQQARSSSDHGGAVTAQRQLESFADAFSRRTTPAAADVELAWPLVLANLDVDAWRMLREEWCAAVELLRMSSGAADPWAEGSQRRLRWLYAAGPVVCEACEASDSFS